MPDKLKPNGDELFHDALIRRQIYLQMYSDGLSDDIVKILDGTEADIHATLLRRLATLETQGFDTGPDTTARLKVLEQSLRAIREPAMEESQGVWDAQLQRVAQAEAGFINDSFSSAHTGIAVDLVLPTATTLATLVSETPFQGKLMKAWADKLAKDDLDRMMGGIVIGLTQGETSEQIAQRILGSASMDGKDGLLQLTRANARAITRTAVNSIANASRAAVFGRNSDVFDEEVFVATLDSHTTPICRSLDGNHYPVGEGPIPPVHWGCRSVRVALIGEKLAGRRPAVGDETETVPSTTTYSDFLTRQSAAFQNEALGPTRAALFRDGGLSLDKFVSRSGHSYTIDQLEKREPAAFTRAGV